LYRSRDLYDTALEEFDKACKLHDAEMETIRQAFIAKWKKVALLESHRQTAIRQQKQKDWNACVWLRAWLNTSAGQDALLNNPSFG